MVSADCLQKNCKISACSFEGNKFHLDLVHCDSLIGLALFKAKTTHCNFQAAQLERIDLLAPWTKLYKISHEKGNANYSFTSGYSASEFDFHNRIDGKCFQVEMFEEFLELECVTRGFFGGICLLPLGGFRRKKDGTAINGAVFDSSGRVIGFIIFNFANLDWALHVNDLKVFCDKGFTKYKSENDGKGGKKRKVGERDGV